MISEQTKRTFEQIVKAMTPEQRAVIQKHFENATEEQKIQMIEKIVSTYEANHREQEPDNTRVTPEANHSKEHQSTEEHKPSHGKRRLKKSVKNALWAIAAVVMLVIIGILGFSFKDKLFGTSESVPSETIATTSVETIQETTPSPTPTVTPTPEPTRVPLASDHPDLTGLTVVIDPGHQQTTDNEQELYASWLSATKPRCTSGTVGIVTGTPEYELTLDYSIIIADYLEQCGATVILTRDSNDVNISNQERAEIAVTNNADLFIRIHADAAGDSATSGVRVYIPDSGDFTDTSPEYAEQLSELIAEAEGLEVNDVRSTSLYTGLNYANTIRSFQISLGFLSNSDDEAVLMNEDNIRNVAEAISVFCEEFV